MIVYVGRSTRIHFFYVVEDINTNRRKVRTSILSDKVLYQIWASHVVDVSYCLNESYIKQGKVFTVADVEVLFTVCTQQALFPRKNDIKYIVVSQMPNSVKLIRKDWREELVLDKDGRVIGRRWVPVFKLCGEKPLSDELRRKLATKVVTRGYDIKVGVSECRALLRLFLDELSHYKQASSSASLIVNEKSWLMN